MKIHTSFLHTKKLRTLHFELKYIIIFEIMFVLFERLFIQRGMPGAIIYILDLVNVALLLITIHSRNWKRFSGLTLSYIILAVMSSFIAIVNYAEWNGNPIYTIIELRNILRFLVFFIACVSILDRETCKMIYKILLLFFFVNAVVIIYQYLTYHPEGVWMRGDYLNGIFGLSVGGNTFVNVTLVVVTAYLLSGWSDEVISTKLFLSGVLISLAIAALIELKAFFVEFFIIYAWYFVKKKKSRKELRLNAVILLCAVIVSYIGLQIMYREYPWFRDTMTLSGMFESLTGKGYTGSGDLNRFTGIFTIAQNMFEGDILSSLFGIGAGNASAFSIKGSATRFFELYRDSHYNWFSGTYTFVQSGAVGLLLYLFTFFYLLWKRKEESEFKLSSQMICIMALFLIFYGEALKTDVGYLVYFSIAAGFVPNSNGHTRCKLKQSGHRLSV